MSVRPRPTEPTHQLPGAAFTALATPSVGSVDTAVWEVRLEPGHPARPHTLTRQEVFVVLSGTGTASLDGVQHPLQPGDVLVVPVATEFALAAAGVEGLVALCCLPVGGQVVIGDGDPFTPPWAV
jgi:mannose-6-phosphate isomerase-like protein (cupin superfamily)